MKQKFIKSRKEYEAYLSFINKQLDNEVKPKSPAGIKLKEILSLIKEYEDKYYTIPKS